MLFGSKKQGKLILMLEMESTLVRISLVWLRPELPPYVAYDESVRFTHKPTLGGKYLIKTALGLLGKSVEGAARFLSAASPASLPPGMPKRPRETHYILTSPWAMSTAKTVSETYDKEHRIDSGTVASLLAEERQKAAKGPAAKGTELIEEKVLDIKLNGYAVANWHDKIAKNLAVSYVMTSGGRDFIARLRRASKDVFPRNDIAFHSSLFLKYAGLRSTRPNDEISAIVQVHGELSDVMTVRNGACGFIGSFPVGDGAIARGIAKAAHIDGRAAESAMSLYEDARMDPSHASLIIGAVDSAAGAWRKSLEEALHEGGTDLNGNGTVVLAVRDHKALFEKALTGKGASRPVAVLDDLARSAPCEPKVSGLSAVALHAAAIHSLE